MTAPARSAPGLFENRLFSPANLAIAALAIFFLSQLHLLWVEEVNWDEFYYLSLVDDFLRGTLTKALQTLHVLFFAWLPIVSGNEITQISAARFVMLLLEMGTVALIYGVTRSAASRPAAAIAALAYLCTPVVLQHGASFRADPIAAFLLMLGLFALSRARQKAWSPFAVALLLAVAAMITMKSVFYAPALVGAALLGSSAAPAWRPLISRLSKIAVTAAVLFGLLYLAFDAILPSGDPTVARSMVSSAFDKTLLSAGLFPRANSIVPAMIGAPVQSLLLIAGAVLAVLAAVRRDKNHRMAIALLLLAAPLTCLIVYRNAFPYFFAFILPPAMPLAGYACDRISRRPLILYAIIVTMTMIGALNYFELLRRDREAQEQTIAAVHAMFPQPVPYIDRCSMIAGFPKQGIFMSSWGLEDYRARGQPIFDRILAQTAPPLLIANSPALVAALTGAPPAGGKGLLPEDAATLHDNYVHHWGAIWLAGKTFEAAAAPRSFDIALAGPYTIGAATAVEIDGELVRPGGIIVLKRGLHVAVAPTPTPVTLKWGNHLPMPRIEPATTPIFWGF